MGNKELVEEIALGPHDLNAVVSGALRLGGGMGDIGDLLFDTFFV